MTMSTQGLSFHGNLLRRGFWLYVWQITVPDGRVLHYVGRTGDSSSTNAQSPFNRMGQHLGFAKNSNMLRRHLKKKDVLPEDCEFRLVAHGPIESESRSCGRADHDARRDLVAAMERALALDMVAAGYNVMNEVRSRKPLDETRYAEVRNAFAASFPQLLRVRGAEP